MEIVQSTTVMHDRMRAGPYRTTRDVNNTRIGGGMALTEASSLPDGSVVI
jgi:hypothetical protein